MKLKLHTKIILFILIFLFCFQSLSFAASPKITAASAILVEVSTGRILYEKNSTKQMYPASVTKILTAIVVLENSKLDDIVTVHESSISSVPDGYVTCDLQDGEELSVKDLLYALLVKSANDAAYVLAEHIGGSIEGFAEMMNNKAKEIGCTNSHFVNPNGIHDEEQYTTAYDLYLMANYAMKNETFRSIVATTSYTLPSTNMHPDKDRTFKNTNELLNKNSKSYYYSNAIGIKTGFTSEAGECLVAQSSRDGLEFISVVLNSSLTPEGLHGRFMDTKKLFNYAYDNFTLTKIREKNTLVDTIEIENATKETKNLDVVIEDSITIITQKDLDVNNLIPEISYKENLLAPITKGTQVGTIKYKVDDIEYSANLLANTDVEEQINYSIFIIAFVLLLIGILLLHKQQLKQKRKRKPSRTRR